ncbi:MAG: U32 family peptidase [Alphaproteobacteria bacterium]|nr:U32 family peptidase [Alphaproteobacteria bacterium]
MELSVGPVQFFWDTDTWRDFYARLADTAPVERVVLGELVCSKRLPFYQAHIPEAVERLQAAGKRVALTSLALVTLPRERALTVELAATGVEIEVNDLSALAHIPEGAAFSVGPLVNVYNEGTLAWLAGRGARRICLPPELPIAAMVPLAQAAAAHGVVLEAWGYGRVPLAISGRCYHARLHGRAKDSCQFVCSADPDGLAVDTLDDQAFLAVNGVQTLSFTCANAANQVEALARAGVCALRLSPHSGDFARTCRLFRERLDGRLDAATLSEALLPEAPGGRFSDGFLTGTRGADWSGAARVAARIATH